MLENEVFIRLVLTDDKKDLLGIGEILKLKPTKVWYKNDIKVIGSTLQYKTNGWEFIIKKDNINHVEEILKEFIEIIKLIKEKKDYFFDIKKIISIIIYTKKGMPSICLDMELLTFFCNANITLEQDIYCM